MAEIHTAVELAHRVAALLRTVAVESQKIEEVAKLLGMYLAAKPDDWKKYSYFSNIHYTRNLVYQDEHVEVMVLCWKAGQVSRIHNHAGSHCWMGVVDGTIQETHYNPVHDSKVTTEYLSPAPEQGLHDPLVKLQTYHHHTGKQTYISDHIALHTVGTDTPTADAISLHIYSPPIKRVKIFGVDLTDLTVTSRTPGFYSKFGERDITRKD